MDAKTNGTLEAFPVVIDAERGDYSPGLTKREEFAKAALQGMVANQQIYDGGGGEDFVASAAVKLADALLAELAKERS